MNKKTLILIVILVGVVALIGFTFSGSKSPQSSENTTSTPEMNQNENQDDNPPLARTDETTSTEEGTSTLGEQAQDNEENQQNRNVTENENTVTFDSSGFSPKSLTVQQGETVTFQNESNSEMWPASDVHPTHTQYDGTSLSEHCTEGGSTSFDSCRGIAPGESWSFTFDKTGTWEYHDHLDASKGGSITVQ